MTDGYDIEVRLNNMEALLDDQDAINKELIDISNEIEVMPEIPYNIDRWLDSIPDMYKDKDFTLTDFKKMFKIQKKYNELLEKRSNNTAKIKVIVIDNLIDRIKDLLDK
jgi:hypothetical protein